VSPQNVELLYFEGCPNHEEAGELVERVAAQAGVELSLRLVEVTSPSVRVNGHDIEPGADDLETFVFACRVYRTASGLCGTPSEEWVRAALYPA
jgi:hypothetical protein